MKSKIEGMENTMEGRFASVHSKIKAPGREVGGIETRKQLVR